MEPEIRPPAQETLPAEAAADAVVAPQPVPSARGPWETRVLRWVFLGSQGLRSGWSIAAFTALFLLFSTGIGFVFLKLHLVEKGGRVDAPTALLGELIPFLGMVAAAALIALIERRRGNLLAFNLTGPHSTFRFLEGVAAGFLALSALVGVLHWGGWLQFGPVALSGAEIVKFAAMWAGAFLVVGCVEEGLFRCYLQFTLTRGIDFWWALGIVALMCGDLLARAKGNGVWGVYAAALLGVAPCLLLQLKKAEGAGFWQAAWVTSTAFGFIHTGNNGENWVGIFAAALVGFVFCVSIRVTGSAWWAIGCHAAWDWAETYFYGTADSGLVAPGHYMTATPAGNPFWSGGADGPEGSALVLGVILLMLAALLVVHGRRSARIAAAPATELTAG